MTGHRSPYETARHATGKVRHPHITPWRGGTSRVPESAIGCRYHAAGTLLVLNVGCIESEPTKDSEQVTD
jgi:hypothetical protein